MSEASAEHYDLVVIGGGPAGEKGAAQAAYFGKRVALIEQAPQLGGAGINTGTVPSKTLRETALYFSGLRQRGLYGIDYSVKKELSVRDFMYRETHVVQELRELVRANLVRHRIDLVRGQASFDDTHRVRVRSPSHPDRVLHGDVILIATGSVPTRPGNMPFHDPRLFDSDSILAMDRIPSSMAVVGAGIIGCEYGTMFAALGVAVTVIDGRERLLSSLTPRSRTGCLSRWGPSACACGFARASRPSSRTRAAWPSSWREARWSMSTPSCSRPGGRATLRG